MNRVWFLIIFSVLVIAILGVTIFHDNSKFSFVSPVPLFSTNLPSEHESLKKAALPPLELKATLPNFEQFLESWLAHLEVSSSTEDMTVLALINKNNTNKIYFLKQLLAHDPDNTMLNFMLAEYCVLNRDAENCDDKAYETLALFDNANGVVNDLKMINEFKQGNANTALDLLRYAGETRFSDDYQWRNAKLLGDSLIRYGATKNSDFIMAINGYLSASASATGNEIINICSQKINDSEWRNACYNRGQSLVESGLTNYSTMIGLSMMKKFVSTEGSAAVDKFLRNYQHNQNELQTISVQMGKKIGWNMSDDQWQQYILIYSQQGEIAAARYLAGLVN